MRPPQGAELRIEFPSRGTTYCNQKYGVYAYDTYPPHSVLAGMERRTFVDSFDTLLEAQVAYPSATIVEGSCFTELNLDFLPDDGDD